MMGRAMGYRQRIRTQAGAIEEKRLLSFLVGHIKARREISNDEALLVAEDVKRYLGTNLRPFGRLELPAVSGRDTHSRRARIHQPEKLIDITVTTDDDVELMRDYGIRTMQNGRIARVIEEAYYQDALLDGPRLQLLFLMNHKALGNRLKSFWETGCILPVCGMTRSNRAKMRWLRPALLIYRYLKGEPLPELKEELAVSNTLWREWWRAFRQMLIMEKRDAKESAEILGLPLVLLEQWQRVYEKTQSLTTARERLQVAHLWEWERSLSDKTHFRQVLLDRHGFSKAAAVEFIDELHLLCQDLKLSKQKPGEICYFAVSAEEPPGRSLLEAELVVCNLEYINPCDWQLFDRDQVSSLKWERLKRLTTQAFHQGAALTQPDLSFLLGISVEAVRKAIKAHPQVVLFTRGQVMDMGPTISHAEKIIRLWMDGYSETDIVKRSQHSYESIERYLLKFAQVLYLLEQGMPVSAIRTVLGSSRKVVERYVGLYQEYVESPDSWRLGQLRRMATSHPVKKKTNTKGRASCRKVHDI